VKVKKRKTGTSKHQGDERFCQAGRQRDAGCGTPDRSTKPLRRPPGCSNANFPGCSADLLAGWNVGLPARACLCKRNRIHPHATTVFRSFTGCGTTSNGKREVSGHDFIRATNSLKSTRALTPEGCFRVFKDRLFTCLPLCLQSAAAGWTLPCPYYKIICNNATYYVCPAHHQLPHRRRQSCRA
jgi:hypothetical protein